ncbi:hypothetical protein KXD40_005471 [Peronospora effusa]|uniref:RxLR effector protein n=1 Tax=Peronospora effusa TaxID=542832 RepID=A0A425CBB0_9STRA|nr:hypothetical protein DD237_005875 [Peronospora effusa]UIZ27338.1 hypothetical protein KXD40_005471 [Peronospora effusa]
MVCTINKLKSLLWYVVLATVAVLTWGPQTMGKMIAASQHNAREKRQLRPRSEETNGGDEERMHSFDPNLPALPESIEGFGETIPMGQLALGENQEAAKISKLIAENDVIGKLAAAKNDPATASIIDDLKIYLLRKWTAENSDKDVFNLLLANKVNGNKVDVTEFWRVRYSKPGSKNFRA